jgi:hypothetical protein
MDSDVERLGDLLGWDATAWNDFSGDPRDIVAEAEAEIARRGLAIPYAQIVRGMLDGAWYTTPEGPLADGADFDLLTAPPEVRVRAMLRILEGR